MADYYCEHAASYFESTADLDPTPFLAPLLEVLPAGARVLDVGCGSGRDLAWLRRHGFRPVGLERSPALAELARGRSGCPVVTADFETHEFEGCNVDAVLLVGALVHLPHGRLAAVLGRILPALDPGAPAGGWVYLSLKEGRGCRKDGCGRAFYLWQDAALARMFASLGLGVHQRRVSSSAAGTGERWLGYVLRRASGGRAGPPAKEG